MSLWVPFRWGALEAVRSAWGGRLAAAIGLGSALLIKVWLQPTWFGATEAAALVTLVGPGLALGSAPPSGAALGPSRDRAWASLWGGLVRAALAGAVAAVLVLLALMIHDRRFAPNLELLGPAGLFAGWSAASALVASALRQLLPRLVLLAGLLAPLTLGALGWVVNALAPRPAPMEGYEWILPGEVAVILAVGVWLQASASFLRPPMPRSDP